MTAWLSTAPVLANGPESQAFKSQIPESLSLRLRFDDGLLSLHVNQQPFAEVLGAIQKETGIRFHYTIPMAKGVTLSFNDLPVQEALKRLLGREAQLTSRFPEGPSAASRTGVPEEIWILGTVSGPILEAGGPTDKSATSIGEGGVARAQSPEPPAPADEPPLDPDPATSEQPDIESLIETTKSEDPMRRLQALSALVGSGQTDQEAVDAALTQLSQLTSRIADFLRWRS